LTQKITTRILLLRILLFADKVCSILAYFIFIPVQTNENPFLCKCIAAMTRTVINIS